MKRERVLEILNDDAKSVEEKVNEIFKERGTEVEDFKKVINTLKTEKQTLENDKLAVETELNGIKENAINPDAVAALETEKDNLLSQIAQMTDAHTKELDTVKYDYLLENELKSAGIVNLKLAKVVLEDIGKDVVKYEDGKITGLDEALKTMKSNAETSILFKASEPEGGLSFSDKSGENGGSVNAFDVAFSKL